MTHVNNRERVSNQAGTQHIQTLNVYGNQYSDPTQREDTLPNYDLGLRLNGAPQIDEEGFVGRERELEKLRTWLAPRPKRQNVVTLCGLGGIGKTQLSIQFATRFGETYSFVFWFNAKDENTVKAGLVALAAQLVDNHTSSSVTDPQEEDQIAERARQWLSQAANDRWLLVYDNYDDPCLPGIPSSTGYDIRKFFPHCVHGSILITTRSRRITFAKQLQLEKLDDIGQSLKILAARSGREVNGDRDAAKLAQRLDGLPLALATAGTYLSQTVNSFGEYLQLYNDRWNDLSQNDTGLLDYEDRTLYSTWNLSLTQIQNQDPAVVELLRLMAYLDNQDLWYELFQAGVKDQPLWWSEVVENRVRFDRAMAILHNYSLVEVRPGSYSLHTCVHDWTLEYLNRDFNDELYVLAIHCIAQSVKDDTEANYWVVNRRLLQHAQRLKHTRISRWIGWSSVRPGDLSCVADLYSQSDMNMEAEEMYVRALRGKEKAWGVEHTSTLNTVNNLGLLYADQGKMVEAEDMYMRALRGYEKAWGADHTSTLGTVNNLGVLYADQGKMVEAEDMYMRALRGYEKAWGADHTSTLDTVNNLGLLYADQGKMAEAEEMYMRALQGHEKAWRADHTSTLGTVNNLGLLYADQGKMAEAEEMYIRALRGKEKAWGVEHTSTLDTVNNLGLLYAKQGKMAEAEDMYMRALRGYEKAWGAEHTSTLDTVHNLGLLYRKQGKMAETEEMYVRALRGKEKAWGVEHTSTLNTVHNLGLLYANQDKTLEAEEMYVRALRGYEKVLGPEHRLTINTAYNLYVLVREQSWKAKFESEGAVENCFHTVEKLIKILKSWESLPINIWGLLGRNLIWLSDELNAQIAFQQGIELQDGMLVYTNVECDGCCLLLTCDMKRFVCQVCKDVDICKHCYDKHKNGEMAISSCTGHPFLEISPEIVSGSSGFHVVGQSERAMWLENLCKQYSPPL